MSLQCYNNVDDVMQSVMSHISLSHRVVINFDTW